MKQYDISLYDVLKKIENTGYEAYFVGGCVRDEVMNKDFYDIDITTSATPSEIKEIFSDYTIIETGLAHGTVTLMYNGLPLEITTFRTETAYTDNRHPDTVKFCSSLIEDLKRRDFTVNSICKDKNGNIIDLLGGLSDIENKIIKAIGDPKERFGEDALRILRALRFSSTLGFKIDDETSKAIHECKYLIENISKERIALELRKMLVGNNIKEILLQYSDVITLILPELKECVNFNQCNYHHKFDVYTHIAVATENAPKVDYMRLAALLHDCAKPQCFSIDENGVGHFYTHASVGSKKAENALKRLRFDNATIKRVSLLIKQHDAYIDESEKIIMRKLNRFGEEILKDLISLQRADTLGLADEFKSRVSHFDLLYKMVDEIIEKNKCFSIKDLNVNGNDIMTLGLNGVEVGKALSFLVEAVIDNKVQNSKKNLMDFLKESIDNAKKEC